MTALLRGLGWTVLRFWEHEPPEEAAEAIIAVVRGNRAAASRATGDPAAGLISGRTW